MLEKIFILVLLCVIGILWVVIQMLRDRIRKLEKHADSWKLLAEHLEKEARGW